MPRRKKNGLASSPKKYHNTIEPVGSGQFGPREAVAMFSSESSPCEGHEAVLNRMLEIFSHLEPQVVHMVLSECDFRAEIAMDSLLELSDAAEGIIVASGKSGFDNIAASLYFNDPNRCAQSHTETGCAFGLQNSLDMDGSGSVLLDEELDSLVQSEVNMCCPDSFVQHSWFAQEQPLSFTRDNKVQELVTSGKDSRLLLPQTETVYVKTIPSGLHKGPSLSLQVGMTADLNLSGMAQDCSSIPADVLRSPSFHPGSNDHTCCRSDQEKCIQQDSDLMQQSHLNCNRIVEDCSFMFPYANSERYPQQFCPDTSRTDATLGNDLISGQAIAASFPLQQNISPNFSGLKENDPTLSKLENIAQSESASSSSTAEYVDSSFLSAWTLNTALDSSNILKQNEQINSSLENFANSKSAYSKDTAEKEDSSFPSVWNVAAPEFFPQNRIPPFIAPVVTNSGNWGVGESLLGCGSDASVYTPSFVWNFCPVSASAAEEQQEKNVKQPSPVPFSSPFLSAKKKRKKLLFTGKVLILMRGVPGSGKSTLARTLLEHNPDGIILSTDDYFSKDGKYVFDNNLLSEAHDWNRKRANEAFMKKISPIIIDNTNIQGWEMKPYVSMAIADRYRIVFREPDTWWKYKPQELERRNIHGVTREKIKFMLDHYENNVSVNTIMNSPNPMKGKSKTVYELLYNGKEARKGTKEKDKEKDGSETFSSCSKDFDAVQTLHYTSDNSVKPVFLHNCDATGSVEEVMQASEGPAIENEHVENKAESTLRECFKMDCTENGCVVVYQEEKHSGEYVDNVLARSAVTESTAGKSIMPEKSVLGSTENAEIELLKNQKVDFASEVLTMNTESMPFNKEETPEVGHSPATNVHPLLGELTTAEEPLFFKSDQNVETEVDTVTKQSDAAVLIVMEKPSFFKREENAETELARCLEELSSISSEENVDNDCDISVEEQCSCSDVFISKERSFFNAEENIETEHDKSKEMETAASLLIRTKEASLFKSEDDANNLLYTYAMLESSPEILNMPFLNSKENTKTENKGSENEPFENILSTNEKPLYFNSKEGSEFELGKCTEAEPATDVLIMTETFLNSEESAELEHGSSLIVDSTEKELIVTDEQIFDSEESKKLDFPKSTEVISCIHELMFRAGKPSFLNISKNKDIELNECDIIEPHTTGLMVMSEKSLLLNNKQSCDIELDTNKVVSTEELLFDSDKGEGSEFDSSIGTESSINKLILTGEQLLLNSNEIQNTGVEECAETKTEPSAHDLCMTKESPFLNSEKNTEIEPLSEENKDVDLGQNASTELSRNELVMTWEQLLLNSEENTNVELNANVKTESLVNESAMTQEQLLLNSEENKNIGCVEKTPSTEKLALVDGALLISSEENKDIEENEEFDYKTAKTEPFINTFVNAKINIETMINHGKDIASSNKLSLTEGPDSEENKCMEMGNSAENNQPVNTAVLTEEAFFLNSGKNNDIEIARDIKSESRTDELIMIEEALFVNSRENVNMEFGDSARAEKSTNEQFVTEETLLLSWEENQNTEEDESAKKAAFLCTSKNAEIVHSCAKADSLNEIFTADPVILNSNKNKDLQLDSSAITELSANKLVMAKEPSFLNREENRCTELDKSAKADFSANVFVTGELSFLNVVIKTDSPSKTVEAEPSVSELPLSERSLYLNSEDSIENEFKPGTSQSSAGYVVNTSTAHAKSAEAGPLVDEMLTTEEPSCLSSEVSTLVELSKARIAESYADKLFMKEPALLNSVENQDVEFAMTEKAESSADKIMVEKSLFLKYEGKDIYLTQSANTETSELLVTKEQPFLMREKDIEIVLVKSTEPASSASEHPLTEEPLFLNSEGNTESELNKIASVEFSTEKLMLSNDPSFLKCDENKENEVVESAKTDSATECSTMTKEPPFLISTISEIEFGSSRKADSLKKADTPAKELLKTEALSGFCSENPETAFTKYTEVPTTEGLLISEHLFSCGATMSKRIRRRRHREKSKESKTESNLSLYNQDTAEAVSTNARVNEWENNADTTHAFKSFDFVGDWPTQQSLEKRNPRTRRKRGPLEYSSSETLSVLSSSKEEAGKECSHEEQVIKCIEGKNVLYDFGYDTECKLLSHLEDQPFTASFILEQEGQKPSGSISVNEVTGNMFQYKKSGKETEARSAELPDPQVAQTGCESNSDLWIVVNDALFTQIPDPSASERFKCRKLKQGKRAVKQCKLALSFANKNPICRDCEREFSTVAELHPESAGLVCTRIDACSQTSPEDFACLWRIQMQKTEPAVTDKSDAFVPGNFDTTEMFRSPLKVPYKCVLDKSTYVEEHELINKNDFENLQILTEHFKSVSADALNDLYERCNKDIEWATNILLDSGEMLCEADEVDLLHLSEKHCDSDANFAGFTAELFDEGTTSDALVSEFQTSRESTSQNHENINQNHDDICVNKCHSENVCSSCRDTEINSSNSRTFDICNVLENTSHCSSDVKTDLTPLPPRMSNTKKTCFDGLQVDLIHQGLDDDNMIEIHAEMLKTEILSNKNVLETSDNSSCKCKIIEDKEAQMEMLQNVPCITHELNFSPNIFETEQRTVGYPADTSRANAQEEIKDIKENEILNNTPACFEEGTAVKMVNEELDVMPPESVNIQSLEFCLPPELAFQLTELFGPVGLDTGSLTLEDTVVQIDLSLAKVIHQKWKESLLERQRKEAISYQLLREDSELSEWLQQEEQSDYELLRTKFEFIDASWPAVFENNKALNQWDTAESFPFMDHWNTRAKTVSLRKIMSEEAALQEYQDMIKPSPYPGKDCASKLKEKQLFEMYPGVDRHFLTDIFKDNNCSLNRTVQFLKLLLGDDPVRTVVAQGAANKSEVIEHAGIESDNEKKSKEIDDENSTTVLFKDTDCPFFEDIRMEAFLHHQKQQEYFSKAAEAYRRGMKQVATYYAQQGHLHGQKKKEANHRASLQIFTRVNASLLPQNILDLHGLHVKEAVHQLDIVLKEKITEHQQSGGKPYLSVITGRGSHSQGGVARIRPAVIDYLSNHSFRFTELQQGLLQIMLK
ncbi:NEDD4-binding protein 2 [Protopterus annectens]|uniref:NEDD4-binding protein 2 n=1 Tax=Protopterus annectens TaxID=7888 RepID=UPI001CFAF22C|nr:NEDD4-binding protein 2 [Protopterus annectens]